jgi:hypothetical protein
MPIVHAREIERYTRGRRVIDSTVETVIRITRTSRDLLRFRRRVAHESAAAVALHNLTFPATPYEEVRNGL